jgi:hypothetical protein
MEFYASVLDIPGRCGLMDAYGRGRMRITANGWTGTRRPVPDRQDEDSVVFGGSGTR